MFTHLLFFKKYETIPARGQGNRGQEMDFVFGGLLGIVAKVLFDAIQRDGGIQVSISIGKRDLK
jgi:hypothetical protein